MITKTYGPKAIVLGRHLKVVQDMGANGIRCLSMLPYRQIAAFSRYGAYQICPDPANDEKRAIDDLYDLCQKEGNCPVLIPYNDTWATAVARQMDRLREVAAPCVANREAVELVLDKERFCRLGQDRGYMTPMSWTAEEACALGDDRFPIVAKPKVHRMTGSVEHPSLVEQMDRLRFIIIKDRADLNRFLDRERDLLPYLTFQEYVRGMSDAIYNIGLYADRSSRILGSVSGHKIRGYPASHGDCILGEKCELPDELMENARRIVADLQLSGLAEFEYKKDSETGEFRLIEINPRAWSWIGITSACGVDLPLMAYRDLTGTFDPSEFVPFGGTVKYVRALDDLENCLFRYGSDCPSWKRSLPEWFRDIRADRTVYYDFDRRDPIPAVVMTATHAQNVLHQAIGMFKGRMGSDASAPGQLSSPSSPDGAGSRDT